MNLRINELLESLSHQSANAVVGQSGLRPAFLREYLRSSFCAPAGLGHSFLSDPLFEAAFGWHTSPHTMGELSGELLQPALVDLLDRPVTAPDRVDGELYRFGKDWHPFRHQEESWRLLSNPMPQSVLVASGTSSGKTECFLVPILDSLVRESADGQTLTGVQALFLYPLNALINSQRDRLTDWTHGFGGRIRYCLYNGETPEDYREAEQRPYSSRVMSRQLLRENPPPILVTNVTMLEYMLVRTIDAPILQKSAGKLRWIVLDEAHTFIGSQAAELSMLLRRVMQAFEVDPAEVRFVATSATIGSGEDVRTRLHRFLADLSGVPADRVHVVEGVRVIPEIPNAAKEETVPCPDALAGLSPRDAFEILANSRPIRQVRQELAARPRTLSEVVEALYGVPKDDVAVRRQAINLLEIASIADAESGPFVPMRVHLFHRPQSGVWTCVNRSCAGRAGTVLDAPDWPFGAVLFKESEQCPFCQSPVFELSACSHCGQPLLLAAQSVEGHLRGRRPEEDDEYAEGIESIDVDHDPGDEYEASAPAEACYIVSPDLAGASPVPLDLATSRIPDRFSHETPRVGIAPDGSCPSCGGRQDRGPMTLHRPVRVGAPLLLSNAVPRLLEFTRPRPPADAHMPAQGRQLITFTDSRQGTARLAARIQHEAERNLIRSVIYHLVQARDPATDQAALQLREEIAKLEPLASGDGPAVKALADIIAVKRGELRSLESADGGVPWDRVVERLSNEPDLEGPLLDVWNGRDSSFSLADRDGSATRLARMLLFREFLRRPRRENSAETMGLGTLRYLAIDGLKAPSVPSLFIEHGASIDDWKDFLYVLVTHFIRANSAVDVDRNIRRWIGRNVPIRFIKSPREEAAEASSLRWPSPFRSKRSRPIRLLKQAFGLDLDDPLNKDLVDDCMEQAWGVIRLLDSRAHTDFTLDLTKASVAGVGDAWFCPVTRTVLDRCFRGITPYLPHVVGPSSINCEPIVLPHLPFPWLVRSDDSKIEPAEVRDWLQTDEKVQTARRMGVWSDLHDRIVQRGMFLRSAEHSAQQPSGRLQRYERAFREGQINVLNCSTTMEMGVDIGGLSVVVMANVPPAPANYLQRVGRAGRRGENLSLGFTVCKDDPLGWSVFRSPAWPFMHAIRPPAVRLDSPVIVQRHVNATLLALFLRTVAPGAKNLRTLEAGWFFERVDATRLSQAEEFIIWCETPGAVMNETRRVALALVQGTCLEESEMLLQDAAAAMREIRSSWIAERDALLADMERTESRDVAQTALQFQIKRLRKSFLLSELSGRSFLPGYGFPTDVVSFVLSDEAMRALAADGVGREDNRFLSRSYPSRQLDIAMREYAPGAEIVLDGLVHRSRGITLNWKRPAGEADTREIQAIAHAWRCRACGAGGTSRTWPVHCSSCGDEGLKVMDYLQPAGFTVDAFERPHADYTRPSYIQPAEPFIAANGGEWIALPDPDLGVCRVTRTGEVFRHTEGPNGYGYALCLHCGRAEAETAPSAGILPPLPDGMRAHVPLRGTQRNGHRDSGVCSGGETPFGIRRHLALGYSIHTDVFELRLVGLSDRTVATSLVVALREALARRLGIDADEMGWAIQPIADGAGSGQYALFLHDNASGGAGFASQGGTLIADILKGAVDVLICPRGCSRSCHSCLLSRDTRFDDEFLDRHKALAFLQDNVLSRLSLRDDRCLFGSASLAENRPLAEALDRRLSEMADARLRVWLSGNPAEWDLENWDGAGLVGKWGMRGRSVDVVFSAAVASNLSFSEAFALDRFAQRTRANLLTVGELPSSPPIIADIRSATQNVAWSGETDALRVPGANWGTSSREPIVRGPCPIDAYTFDTQPFDPGSKVLSGQAGAIPLSITAELNGPAREFGKRFWEIVKASAPDIAAVLDVDGAPVDIAYSDRYLVNPLTLRLLFEVLRPFVAGKRDNGSVSTVTVRTLAERAGGRPSLAAKITDDWNDLRQRDSVAEIAGRLVGVDLHLVPMALRDLPHHRSIEISCGGTNARVFLDQGFGYWTTASRTRFDFNARAVDQARSMLAAAFEVVQRGSHPTMLFVMRD